MGTKKGAPRGRRQDSRHASGQGELFEEPRGHGSYGGHGASVRCLGMTFESQHARRQYFLDRLREGLVELDARLGGVPFTTVEDAVQRLTSIEHWPMAPLQADGRVDEALLRQIAERMRAASGSRDLLQRWRDEVGFPQGATEDILRVSDPPHYTACPNPFVPEFVASFVKPYKPESDGYSCEPFAADVSESRNNPFVNAHSYATKVPHKIVMQYLMHYTQPGDVVLDPFCGTGMAGIAAQLCADASSLEGSPNGQVGPRLAILKDLSPAATHIARSLNLPDDMYEFETAARDALHAARTELGWMYETLHTDGKTLGRVHCILWSDCFTCPECGAEVNYWNAAVDIPGQQVRGELTCPGCGVTKPKRGLERAWQTFYDPLTRETVRRAKAVPHLVIYSIPGHNRRLEKHFDARDTAILERIADMGYPLNIPFARIPQGDKTVELLRVGLTHVHHLFTLRNLHALSYLWERLQERRSRFTLTALMYKSSILCAPLMSNYFAEKHGKVRGGWVGKERSGTLYYPSIQSEVNVFDQLETRTRAAEVCAAGDLLPVITVGSATHVELPANSVDYVFADPPFGSNRMYSELNYLWEAWLGVKTNTVPEAVVNRTQRKSLESYESLMERSFRECYRVLKPGRWLTVEFSNTSALVWNQIQVALGNAGFVIADVRTLSKGQGSINAYNTRTAVKQDLVISAYKPTEGLESRFALEAGTDEGVWDFLRSHLGQLPIFVARDGRLEVVSERQDYMLFDRMVAFHVQRGVTVPMSMAQFLSSLAQRYPCRDGMYFLPEQATEYDGKRLTVKEVLQLSLFVTDEASAVQWLKAQLTRKPQTYQEIHPQFLREIGGWEKHERPLELAELLEQNFLMYDGEGDVPSQIHSYLSSNWPELRNKAKDDPALRAKAKNRWYVPDPGKAQDLEKLRDRALLREFWSYLPPGYTPTEVESPGTYLQGMEAKQGPIPKGKRIKVIRMEAVRAGFKHCWQNRDYRTIIAVARRIPDSVLQEDPKLLMWYDQAVTRLGEDS